MAIMDLEQREFISKLIEKGDYDLALEEVVKLEESNTLQLEEKILITNFKAKILNALGFFKKALEFGERTYEWSKKFEKEELQIDSIFNIVESLTHLGDIQKSQRMLSKLENLLINPMTLDEKALECYKMRFLYQKGIIFKTTGNLTQAINNINTCLKYYTINNEKFERAECYSCLGLIYAMKGDLNKSMTYMAQSIALFQQIDNTYKIATALNNMGEICRQMGFLEQSLRNFQQSLHIWEEMGNREAISNSLKNIGTIYYLMSDYKQALAHFELCIKLNKEIGNKISIAENLYQVIKTYITQNQTEKAQEQLLNLEEINKELSHKPTDQIYRISKALILKSSKKLRNWLKAIEILEGVIIEDVSNYEVTIDALLHLCELYLREYKASNEIETLNDLELAIKTLSSIAERQQSQKLYAETYWLKAHLALVKLNLEEAKALLAKAQQLAEEYDLHMLAMKISNDYDQLLHQFEEWTKLKKDNAPVAEILKLSQVEELINNMLQQGITDIKDLPKEEPVYIAILSKDGGAIYAKTFKTKENIDDQLIGGFLTAMNSFLTEAFSTSGSIERIKHKEYTFVLKPEESFLFCYVFKGNSYYAMQKLEQFIQKVKEENEIWQIFQNFVKTGMIISTNFKEKVNYLADDLFVKADIH
ncbi:MAG: tetratricopeptide repeat protein [Candidatus Heimdallarchaeota archaeon]|nr:tetratricopeptide repeat protein [Candidatus Heimdallarchaeota archaeon]